MTVIDNQSRLVPLDGGINFRDIGGYVNTQGRTVKWRKIMRCGHLANLTEGDLDTLESIVSARFTIFVARRSRPKIRVLLFVRSLSMITRCLLAIFRAFGSFCLMGR